MENEPNIEPVRSKAIRSFRDLEASQKARQASYQVFLVTRRFPAEERYAMTDQVRRSSRAVASMIAEAWARRRYPAAFIDKVNQAQGEASESQAWLDQALDCGYISPDMHVELDAMFQALGGKLQRMIDKSGSFCG
jgi:four helix bundle protein